MDREIEEEKQYPITISDWIVYLGNTSSMSISLLIFLSSFVVIVIIGLMQWAISGKWTGGLLALTIVIILIIYLLFLYVIRFSRKITRKLENLSEKIVRGEITNSKEILDEYKRIKQGDKKE